VSRIQDAFARARKENRAALVAYLMAGDPDLATSEKLAVACIRGGANLLELGLPFSDPIADGPEIQAAGQRALKAGTHPRDVLDLAARLRRESDVPLLVMTYLNPILAIGLKPFADRAAAAGVDGVIVPDLSLEESPAVSEVFDAAHVDLVQLVAPSTAEARARSIGAASRGFVYVVARYGTTGVRSELPEDLRARLATLHRATTLPLAVGFGVSTPDHVRTLAAAGADGVVVGSAIVRKAAEDADPAAVEAFVRTLASGVRA
jgi:tryptophan synthase alpha chain